MPRIFSNSFPLTVRLSNLGFEISVYDVKGVPQTPDKYTRLGAVSRAFSEKVLQPTASLTTRDGEIIVAVGPLLEKPLFISPNFEVVPNRTSRPSELPYAVERIAYERARSLFQASKFWNVGYSRYYEYQPEKASGDFEVYRGLWFRFDVFRDRLIATLDPLTRITPVQSLWALISAQGTERVKKEYLNRLFVFDQGQKRSIVRLIGILEKTVAQATFEVENSVTSVKAFLSRRNAGLAETISDLEPTVQIKYNSDPEAKVYHTAPSLLKPVLDPERIPNETKSEVYLTGDRRSKLITKYLSYIKRIDIGGAKLTFSDHDLSAESPVGMYDPPRVKFGSSFTIKPRLAELRGFYQRNLERYGPEKKPEVLKNIVVAYPNEVAERHAEQLYNDSADILSRYFQTAVNQKPVLWRYSVPTDLNTRIGEYGDRISGVIVILRSKFDESYFTFKQMLQAIPNQMITSSVLNLRYSLPSAKMGRYTSTLFVAISGFAAKMGARPWILDESLNFDYSIGFDIGGTSGRAVCYSYVFDKFGRNLGIDHFMPQNREALDADDLQRAITDIVSKKASARAESLAIHRDGIIQRSEMQGISEAVEKLISQGRLSSDCTVVGVNVKKNVPFRLFSRNGYVSGCDAGSYMILTDSSAIVATTGAPLLHQGIAQPLLIEKVPVKGDADILKLASDIYRLTHLNWGSGTKTKLPVTIKYAEDQTLLVSKGVFSTTLPF